MNYLARIQYITTVYEIRKQLNEMRKLAKTSVSSDSETKILLNDISAMKKLTKKILGYLGG